MSTDELRKRVEKLESQVLELTKENSSYKSENKELQFRLAEIEKKLGITPTVETTASVITRPKAFTVQQEKNSKEDNTTNEPQYSKFQPEPQAPKQKTFEKFVPESNKKPTAAPQKVNASASNTEPSTNSNISYEKLISPKGNVEAPDQLVKPSEAKNTFNFQNQASANQSSTKTNTASTPRAKAGEESKELDQTIKNLAGKTAVKFVTNWISADNSESVVTIDAARPRKTSGETQQRKASSEVLDSTKSKDVSTTSNSTQAQSQTQQPSGSNQSLNIAWKSNGLQEIKKPVEKKEQLNVTNVKLDMAGASSPDYKTVLDVLAQFKNVDNIEIKGMLVENGDAISSLTAGFNAWQRLEVFKLQNVKGSALDMSSASKLTEAIKANKTLKELRISCRNLQADVELQLKSVEKGNSKFQIWAV